MTNTDLMEILTVADTIENNGGWHIAAAKLRAFVGEHKALDARCHGLEAALTKFLVWNGTDHADDESREYALVGICEEAYALIPASARETKLNPAQGPLCKTTWDEERCTCPLHGFGDPTCPVHSCGSEGHQKENYE